MEARLAGRRAPFNAIGNFQRAADWLAVDDELPPLDRAEFDGVALSRG